MNATLRAGGIYYILAVADDDCGDLDLELYDENDNLIDTDLAHDSAPVVSVTPIRTATFRYRVSMIHCAHNPCFYVSGVWQTS
ncbi:MAG: hypothetical protein RML57_10230 [Acidobacteriota bacterium]|nr:hypothetical protein [Acidobacteriota bacterium]